MTRSSIEQTDTRSTETKRADAEPGFWDRFVTGATRLPSARPRLVLLVFAMLAAISLLYTTLFLSIHTDTAGMLSRKLPFRQALDAYRQAFPQYRDELICLVEAPSSAIARKAANMLAIRMSERPEWFREVFYPPREAFFRRHYFLYLEQGELDELIDRLVGAQAFLASLALDPSLRGFSQVLMRAVAEAGSSRGLSEWQQGDFAAMLVRADRALAAVIAEREDPIDWQGQLGGDTATSDGPAREIILTQPVLNFASLAPAGPALAVLRTISAEISTETGASFRFTGPIAFDQEELASVQSNIVTIELISVALVALLLIIGMVRGNLILAALAALLTGLVITAALGLAMVGSFNLISVTFAILFTGLGIDFAIHLCLRWREETERGADAPDALRQSVGPLLLCACSSALAFFSFLPTHYRGLAELGLIAGTGMFVALLTSLAMIPAWLTLWPGSVDRARQDAETWRFANDGAVPERPSNARRRARIILWAAGVLFLCGLGGASQLRLDFDPLHLRDPNSPALVAFYEWIGEDREAALAADSLIILMPNLAQADRQAEILRDLPGVGRVITASHLLPEGTEAKLESISQAADLLAPILSLSARLPPPGQAEIGEELATLRGALSDAIVRVADQGGELPLWAPTAAVLSERLEAFLALPMQSRWQEALFQQWIGALPTMIEALSLAFEAGPVKLADVPRSLRRRAIAADGTARIEIRPVAPLDDASRANFVATVSAIAVPTGVPAIILAARVAVLEAMLSAGAITLLASVLLLGVALRSVNDVMLVLIPLALAMAMTAMTAAGLGIALNFANVIVLPLLIGLGMHSAIHVILRARTLQRHGQTQRLGMTTTPRAVLFSALTTIAAFGTLMASPHRGTASIGALLTVALCWTLVATLIVLPSLLVLRTKE